MPFASLAGPARRFLLAPLAVSAALALGACGDDDDGGTGPDQDRMYNQVQRLGNPLVSEVLLAKRDHPLHGSVGPADDAASIGDDVRAFVRDVAGRSEAVQNTLATVLLPDMLIVQTDRDPGTAGWLTWALADGYGGRQLSDDVVDGALSAVFGALLDPNNTSPGLASDNVGNDSNFQTTFPYVAPAN